MGSISVEHARGSTTARLDGNNLHTGRCPLVCFLYHCFGLSTNSPHDCATICLGCEITREQGIRLCRGRNLTRALAVHQERTRHYKQRHCAKTRLQALHVSASTGDWRASNQNSGGPTTDRRGQRTRTEWQKSEVGRRRVDIIFFLVT